MLQRCKSRSSLTYNVWAKQIDWVVYSGSPVGLWPPPVYMLKKALGHARL